MRSPFPGMDPYLESRWSGIHLLLMGAITAALNRTLPDGLEARPEQDVRIATLAGERLRGFRPDVAVVSAPMRVTEVDAGVAMLEPIVIHFLETPVPVRHVEIVDASDGGRVVTAIEVLSPWNKLAGDLNDSYRRKLQAYEDAGTSWVEIDLLRSSRRRLRVTWDDVPPPRRAVYLVGVHRAFEGRIVAYPIGLRDRLPTFGVPLREDEPDVALDLQAALDRAYADGPTRSIDYAQPLDPPLAADDAAWLAGLLAARAS